MQTCQRKLAGVVWQREETHKCQPRTDFTSYLTDEVCDDRLWYDFTNLTMTAHNKGHLQNGKGYEEWDKIFHFVGT